MQHTKRAPQELNRTIVIVLHDINFAGHYSDYICAMKHGKVVQFGTPVQVIEGPNGPLAVYY